jgi:Meckel syndrome type 1 protein
MQSVKTAVSNAVTAQTNPFFRLVTAALGESDSASTVSFYKMEELREATHQSDAACETVHRALIQRLDASTNILTQHKILYAIRGLLLEGPPSFAQRMTGAALHRIAQLTQIADPRRDSPEEHVRRLARAVHVACTGGGQTELLDWTADGTAATARPSGAPRSATAGAAVGAGFQSEFAAQQEREMKAWRRRQQEQRAAGVVVTQDRALLQFNPELAAPKFVDAVLQSDKKKFASEEVFGFTEALLKHPKRLDVCTLLERVLAGDGAAGSMRYPLAQRHKVLQLVEGVVLLAASVEEQMQVEVHKEQHVSTSAAAPVLGYWKANSAAPTSGLRKLAVVEAADNPAKAQQTREMALRTLQALEHLVIPSGFDGASGAPAPAPAAARQQAPAPAAAAFGGTAGAFGFGAPAPAVGSDIFAGLNFSKPAPSAQPARPAAAAAPVGFDFSFNAPSGGFAAPAAAPAPAAPPATVAGAGVGAFEEMQAQFMRNAMMMQQFMMSQPQPQPQPQPQAPAPMVAPEPVPATTQPAAPPAAAPVVNPALADIPLPVPSVFGSGVTPVWAAPAPATPAPAPAPAPTFAAPAPVPAPAPAAVPLPSGFGAPSTDLSASSGFASPALMSATAPAAPAGSAAAVAVLEEKVRLLQAQLQAQQQVVQLQQQMINALQTQLAAAQMRA